MFLLELLSAQPHLPRLFFPFESSKPLQLVIGLRFDALHNLAYTDNSELLVELDNILAPDVLLPNTDDTPPNLNTLSTPTTPSATVPSTPSTPASPRFFPATFTPPSERTFNLNLTPKEPPKIDDSDDEMTTKTPELFRGNGTAVQAHVWLQTMELGLKSSATDEEKVERFETCLYPGSPAERWFGTLQAADKADWKSLKVAFKKQWPRPQPVERLPAFVVNELKGNRLDIQDVGVLVDTDTGDRVYSHVIWVERVRRLLGELDIPDSGMLLMSDVRETLPIQFRRLIPTTGVDTWDQWLTAVENISPYSLEDVREDARALGLIHDVWDTTAVSHPLSPQPQRWQQRAWTPSPQGAYTAPAARKSQAPQSSFPATPSTQQAPIPMTPSPSARGPLRTSATTLFGSTLRGPSTFPKFPTTPGTPSPARDRPPHLPNTPTSLGGDLEQDRVIARAIAEQARLYQGDTASIQRYTSDMAAWEAGPREWATFPFTPGTVAPGSRECFGCGTVTDPPHGASRCTATLQIPQRERSLRLFVNRTLYPPKPRFGIAQVNDDPPYDIFGGHNPDDQLFDDEDSGNGEERAQ
ncbi:hypothetical protein FB45DRAFT_1031797 [Roridomyces roridus]|uniref:Uncharacterized protein n=1 Tax=Roridomyces roridus TaxID=1738132 RepID=A0AAD7BIC0_9AGAR|nr:hypothetical protein FB45DRAFT_1031797 [Roridomyces roridus]